MTEKERLVIIESLKALEGIKRKLLAVVNPDSQELVADKIEESK
jgi:hypothetical protein